MSEAFRPQYESSRKTGCFRPLEVVVLLSNWLQVDRP